MRSRQGVVLDTNVWVSFAFFERSGPWRVVRHALDARSVVATDAILSEVQEVLRRPKFDRYATPADRDALAAAVPALVTRVVVRERLRVCHDPNDDKFLEAAVAGDAGMLVTGDRHLLALHPFRRIDIVTPTEYLRRHGLIR